MAQLTLQQLRSVKGVPGKSQIKLEEGEEPIGYDEIYYPYDWEFHFTPIQEAIGFNENSYFQDPFNFVTDARWKLQTEVPVIRYPEVCKLETPEDFVKFQRGTSKVIFDIKDGVLEAYRKSVFKRGYKELMDANLQIHENRRDKVLLRGVHSRIYNLVLGGLEDIYVPRVGAAIEFLLDDMYYLNQIFDTKSGPNAAKNMIASIMSNDLFWSLLIPPVKKQKQREKLFRSLNEDFNKIISHFYYGEYIDSEFNTWRHWNELDPNLMTTFKEADFTGETFKGFDLYKLLHRRTYYINTTFFQGIVNMAGKVISEHQGKRIQRRKLEALAEYSYNFGLGLQLVNDVADFVPIEFNAGTSAKQSRDSYNDIQNSKMTLPVVYMLKYGSDEDREKVIAVLESGFEATPEQLRETTDIMLRTGVYAECRIQCRKYKKKCADVAREFTEPAHFLLAESAVVLDSNRYFKALTEMGNEVK